MRRLLPLLLLAAPILCWAASDPDATPKRDACDYSRPTAPSTAAADDSQQAQPATPTAARTSPKPSASANGGNDGEISASRARSPRWHSFLPGMFR